MVPNLRVPVRLGPRVAFAGVGGDPRGGAALGRVPLRELPHRGERGGTAAAVPAPAPRNLPAQPSALRVHRSPALGPVSFSRRQGFLLLHPLPFPGAAHPHPLHPLERARPRRWAGERARRLSAPRLPPAPRSAAPARRAPGTVGADATGRASGDIPGPTPVGELDNRRTDWPHASSFHVSAETRESDSCCSC